MSYRALAAAIRRGHPLIKEERAYFLLDDCGCAIGAALVGIGYTYANRVKDKDSDCDSLMRKLAKHFHVPEDIVRSVSKKHYSGIPRLALADWLDSLEPVAARPSDAEYTRQFVEKMEHLSPTLASCPD